MKKLIIGFFLFFQLSFQGIAFEGQVFQYNKAFFHGPTLMNRKYFDFEFSYVSKKKIKSLGYSFNAFAGAFIAEESYALNPHLRAGALGFKGGLYLPTNPWLPLFLQFSFGFAKTAYHERPWFGKNEQSVDRGTLLFVGMGALYQYKVVIFRFVYQVNNLDYLIRKSFFSLGANF